MKEPRKEQIRKVLKYQRDVNGQISKMCQTEQTELDKDGKEIKVIKDMPITTIRDIFRTDRPRHEATDTDSVWIAAETILKERGAL
jgi:hypothetical protein